MFFKFGEGGAKRRVMHTAYFDFLAVGENNCGNKKGISQSLKGRKRRGRG
jgi:hypothetical protein